MSNHWWAAISPAAPRTVGDAFRRHPAAPATATFVVVNSEAVPALSIGTVLGDSDTDSQSWKRGINALSKRVAEARQGVESPLAVNVVFHVDGKLAPNEFSGVRTGRFSKAKRHLMVQPAVPSGSVIDRRAVLAALLMEALDEAEAFAQGPWHVRQPQRPTHGRGSRNQRVGAVECPRGTWKG